MSHFAFWVRRVLVVINTMIQMFFLCTFLPHLFISLYGPFICVLQACFVFVTCFVVSGCNVVTYYCLTVSVSFLPVDDMDVSSTANLYKSLAQAAPEIKQCVDACNFIAESTRQQNSIGSVSFTLTNINAIPIIFYMSCFVINNCFWLAFILVI